VEGTAYTMADYKDHIGPFWPGYPGIANLIVFGDSYSSIGYPNFYPRPDKEHPLGSPLPAYVWTESKDKPNWVGHLVSKHKANPDLLVYNYAVGGDNVRALENQVKKRFLPHVGIQPDWAPWKSSNTLFVTWIGVNDCATLDSDQAIEETQKKLFDLEQELYLEGARNFLFIDVPPMEKFPAFPKDAGSSVGRTYERWNEILRKNVKAFLSENKDVTTMVLSSWEFFNLVFQTPSKYGFGEGDIRRRYGPVWADNLHPTSRMHEHFAARVNEFLSGHPAGTSVQPD